MGKKSYWNFIPGISHEFMASSVGEIMNLKTHLLVNRTLTIDHYYKVSLHGHNYKLHRLIALAFVPNNDPSHKICVNHINEIRTDDRASNLEWVTVKQNNCYGHHNERISRSLSRHENMPVILVRYRHVKWFRNLASAARYVCQQNKSLKYKTVRTKLGMIASCTDKPNHIHTYGCVWCPYGKSLPLPKRKIIADLNGTHIKFSNRATLVSYLHNRYFPNNTLTAISSGIGYVLNGKRYEYKGISVRYSNETAKEHRRLLAKYHHVPQINKLNDLYVYGHGKCKIFKHLLDGAFWIKKVLNSSKPVHTIKYNLSKTTHYSLTNRNRTAYGFQGKWLPKDVPLARKQQLKKWIIEHDITNPYRYRTNKHVQLNKDGSVIRFVSLAAAARYVKRLRRLPAKEVSVQNAISMVCRGKRKHAYGYSCKFVK